MDERLKLTERQSELAKKFNELCEEMKREKIGFINDGFNGNVILLNLEKIEDWVDVDDMNLEDEVVDEQLADMEEMFLTHINFFFSTGVPDSFIGIRFKK